MSGEPVVFVVDDDASVLRAITRLLRVEFVVQGYGSPATFLAAVHPETPGCIVLDLALPGMSGLELQTQLIQAGCLQPVVFLSGQGSVRAVVQALHAGAIDFLEKPWESEALIGAVRRALECDREIRSRRDATVSISRRVESLTPRESDVFRHVIAGRLNKQIAAKLGTAEKTIKVHRARVMHKMSVRSVAELTRAAELAGVRPEA
jgi:FixJ family two-component response regulator